MAFHYFKKFFYEINRVVRLPQGFKALKSGVNTVKTATKTALVMGPTANRR
jgi:hypothetical protein